MHSGLTRWSALPLLSTALLLPNALQTPAASSARTGRALDGYTIVQRIDAEQDTITLTLKVSGAKLRIEMDVGSAGLADGMYMLARDDGRVVAVMGSSGMALVMDPAAVVNGAGGLLGAMGKSTVDNVSVSVDDIGPGDVMHGRPTRKYKMRTRYKRSVNATGQMQTSNYDVTQDMWMGPELPAAQVALEKFATIFAGAFAGVEGSGDKAVAESVKGKMPKGYPFRTVTTIVETPDGSTRSTTTKVTSQVTSIRQTTFEPSDFEVPAGMQVLDVGQFLGGRGGN